MVEALAHYFLHYITTKVGCVLGMYSLVESENLLEDLGDDTSANYKLRV